MVITGQMMGMPKETSTRTITMEVQELETRDTAPALVTPILMPATTLHIQKMAIQEQPDLQEEASAMTLATMAAMAIPETMGMGISQMKKIRRMKMGRIGGLAEVVHIAINKMVQCTKIKADLKILRQDFKGRGQSDPGSHVHKLARTTCPDEDKGRKISSMPKMMSSTEIKDRSRVQQLASIGPNSKITRGDKQMNCMIKESKHWKPAGSNGALTTLALRHTLRRRQSCTRTLENC